MAGQGGRRGEQWRVSGNHALQGELEVQRPRQQGAQDEEETKTPKTQIWSAVEAWMAEVGGQGLGSDSEW